MRCVYALVACLALLAGCFRPELDEAQFSCKQGRCPNGYTCSGEPAFKCVSSAGVALDLGATPPEDGPAADEEDGGGRDAGEEGTGGADPAVVADAGADAGDGADATPPFVIGDSPSASLSGVMTDTHIDEAIPGAAHGSDGTLEVNGVPGDRQTSLLRWDLTSLAGRQVRAARLRLYVIAGRDRIHFHEILVPWGGDASFTQATSELTWPTAGCELLCRSDAPFLTADFLEADTFASVELDAALVQRWIDSPSSNHGILMRLAPEDGAGRARFLSSDHLTYPERRPALELELDP